MADDRPLFSDLATGFILSRPQRRQKQAMAQACRLARYPFVEKDCHLIDENGRQIEHLLVNGLVFSYWLDHSARLVLITEIEDADSG